MTRVHFDNCASLCTNYGYDDDVWGGCDVQHRCWCKDGDLSYRQYQQKHDPRERWANWAEARGYRRQPRTTR